MLGWGYSVAGIPVAVIGFRSRRIRTHTIMGIVFFVWQVVFGFDVSPFAPSLDLTNLMKPTAPLRRQPQPSLPPTPPVAYLFSLGDQGSTDNLRFHAE